MNESLGKIFKDARRAKGITVGEVSKKTKISHNVISAIEEDNFEVLSPVYIKSFVKIYAKLLDLDIEKVLKLYYEYSGLSDEDEPLKQKRLQPTKVIFEASFISGITHALRKKGKILIVIIALALLFFIGKAIFKNISIHRQDPQAKKVMIKEAKVKEVKPKEAIKEEKGKDNLAGLDLSESLRLTVRAKADCWLNVKIDEKLIFQSVLKKGEVESWQADKKMELRIGNPAAVDLELNGRVLEQFGKRSSKAKFVTITKEGLKVGK